MEILKTSESTDSEDSEKGFEKVYDVEYDEETGEEVEVDTGVTMRRGKYKPINTK